MDIASILTQSLTNLATQIPILATWFVGGVLAVVLWRRDPHGSILTLISCLISMVHAITFSALYGVLPYLLQERMASGASSIHTIFIGMQVVGSFLTALAWILILVAVFRKRPAA